jgi:hypothetical protein
MTEQTNLGETGRVDHRRKTSNHPRIVGGGWDHPCDANPQRVMVAGGQRDRGVVAIEHSDPATRLEHAKRLGEQLFGAGCVRQEAVEHGHVERRIGRRPFATVGLAEQKSCLLDKGGFRR